MSEVYSPDELFLTDAEQRQFHIEIEPWLDSMIKRHGMNGRLTKLPFDPGSFEFQDMNIGIVKARIPSAEEISSFGRDQAQELAMAKIKQKGYEGVGVTAYEAMVGDMLSFRGGQTLNTILHLMSRPDAHVTELLAHANLQDVPFAQLVTLDALSQTAKQVGSALDVFDIIDQSFSYASETMTRLAWDDVPVIHILSGSANVVKVFPPTENGVKLKVNREYKHFINDRSKQAMELENLRLKQAGRSRLDYKAAAASTMDKVWDGDKLELVGLVPKKINPVAATQIVEGSVASWPLAIWFSKDMELSWQLTDLTRFTNRDDLYAAMRSLNEATAHLAGAVIMDKPED